MVKFFKKSLSVVTTGLRWILGAILGVTGAATFMVGGVVCKPFEMARIWAAKRTWTKPINWLLAPGEYVSVAVAATGIAVALGGAWAFWPELKGTELGECISELFNNGLNKAVASGLQGMGV